MPNRSPSSPLERRRRRIRNADLTPEQRAAVEGLAAFGSSRLLIEKSWRDIVNLSPRISARHRSRVNRGDGQLSGACTAAGASVLPT